MELYKAAIVVSLTGVVLGAPPFVPDYPSSSTTSRTTTTTTSTTTTTIATTTTTLSTTTTFPTIKHASTERLSGETRRYLLQDVPTIGLDQVGKLNLSPKQRLALSQEFEYQQLGLPPFTDPTPWQRLTRDQQLEFNRKYLALPPVLQEYSRNQFLSLPDDRQEKAYNTFVTVDIETLTNAIEREYSRERLVLERRTLQEKVREEQNIQRLLEQKRMQYSAMNAKIVTDILDNDIDNDEEQSDLIEILKQQLSTSLQVARLQEPDITDNLDLDAIIVTTNEPIPEVPRSHQPLPININKNIKFHRLNDINTDEEYLKTSSLKTSPRVPKSNSSILTARASLFARRFQSSPNKVSVEQKRNNIQRLMYDPRRKL